MLITVSSEKMLLTKQVKQSPTEKATPKWMTMRIMREKHANSLESEIYDTHDSRAVQK